MTQITFARLRDSEDWGLRGEKESPTDVPPEEGKMVTVTRRNGETQDVQMGRVLAQGDDWWLATVGASNKTNGVKDQLDEMRLAIKALDHRISELEQAQGSGPQTDPEREAIQQEGGDEPREANPWA